MPTSHLKVAEEDAGARGTYSTEYAATSKTHPYNTRPPRSKSDEDSGDGFDEVDPIVDPEDDDEEISSIGDGGGKPAATTQSSATPPASNKKSPRKHNTTPAHNGSYSGLGATATVILQEEDHDDLLRDDLTFQRNPGGDSTVFKAYKLNVLQHSGLVVFAFMRPGSSSIHLIHSPQTYVTHRQDDDLRGKDIAFVGDRTQFQPSPTAIILSEKSPWSWITKPFHLDQTAMETFYADGTNKHKLWVPPPPSKKDKSKSFPRLLFLPTAFVPYCTEKPRTPFELYQGIIQYITTSNTSVTLDDCKLVLNWCIAAAHTDAGSTTSWLAYPIEAAISNNPRFYQWTNRRLTTVLGTIPGTTSPSTTIATPASMDWKSMEKHLRAGIVEGLRPVIDAAKQDDLAPSAATSNKGKEYDEQQWYMLMGFSHVSDPEALPPVWASFTQTKNSEAHRLEIGAHMRSWGEARRVVIVKNMEFSERTLGYIVKMQFNPPGCAGTAFYSSIDKGLTILSCRPPEGEELEALRDRELKELQVEGNRTLADILSIPAIAGNIKPAEDYHELHLNLGTFCALLWTLFGPKCHYYMKCFSLWKAMEDDTIFAARRRFTPLLCRQLTWAIIEDGRRYFSRVMTQRHFDRIDEGEEIEFPKSRLDDVKDAVLYQTSLMRPSFPAEWRGDWQGGKRPKLNVGSVGVASFIESTATTPTAAIQAAHSTPSVISGVTLGSTESQGSRLRRPTQAGIRETDLDTSLKALMQGHLRANDFIQLGAVLRNSNLSFSDLPTLPKYMVNGRNALCYNYVLGNCTSKFCKFKNSGGHAPAEDITREFSSRMCKVLETPLAVWNQTGAKEARAVAARK
jgi:hypothetical protein